MAGSGLIRFWLMLQSGQAVDGTNTLNLDSSSHQPLHDVRNLKHSQHGAEWGRSPTDSSQHPPKLKDQSKSVSITKLVTSAPRERTLLLDEDIQIVPPPPPLALNIEDSESNTQSDMDSDVFCSSRSELESSNSKIASDPKLTERLGPQKASGGHLTALDKNNMRNGGKTPENFSDTRNSGADKLEKSSLETSFEFNEQLLALKTVLDERLGSEKTSSGSSVRSSVISFTDSAIGPSIKLVEDWQKSLVRQSRLESEDEDQDEYDDDDDVIVTFYGDEPAYDPPRTKPTLLPSVSPDKNISNDTSRSKVKEPAQIPGNSDLDQLLESEVSDVCKFAVESLTIHELYANG